METSQPSGRFGTFTGVFTPTLLTILGVIMYVRLGWVVGNAGLLGAYAILFVGLVITLCTGLSLSSIATNTRLGAGGPYAIVSRSLGLEVAGAVGIPLYLTRPLGIAMYIFGFREGIQYFVPGANELFVDLFVFAVLFGVAYRSAEGAFWVQYIIMALIGASLVSIATGEPTTQAAGPIQWFGSYGGFPESGMKGTDFWGVFAVFFPATTGILAGANMSGDLKDPRRAIASGTLWAIALSSIIYLAIATWVSRAGTPEELSTNYQLLIERSWAPSLVVIGLLGATASSALAGLVGGPRILMAMGQDRLLPGSAWLAATSGDDAEPRNAALITGVLTFAALMVRDLNAIAPLVTMFFLITYCIINVVVLFEQGLGLVSFRPSLRVPTFVPLIGTIGSLFAMFIVNPTFGILAMCMVVCVYVYIDRFVEIEGNSSEEARSSVFAALVDYAVQHAQNGHALRAWKPRVLVPVKGVGLPVELIAETTLPEGSVTLLGVNLDPTELDPMVDALRGREVSVGASCVAASDFETAVSVGLQALQSSSLRPNLLFLGVPSSAEGDATAGTLVTLARRTGVGSIIVGGEARLGRERVRVWVRGGDWDLSDDFHGRNLNIALLTAYRLTVQWGAVLELVTVVDPGAEDQARHFLSDLVDVARMPRGTQCRVEVGDFHTAMAELPPADLHILGLQPDPDFVFARRVLKTTGATVMFVMDSGRESALT